VAHQEDHRQRRTTATSSWRKPLVVQINEKELEYQKLSEDALKAKTLEFRDRLAKGATTDDLLVEAFAVVKNACRRLCGTQAHVCGHDLTWEMVPFDVQLVGGMALHQRKIAEMATGEGKTLVATMPAYLNALTGRGVHVVTVNDYLARRDSEWMGHVFKYLGLTVGCIQNQMEPASAGQHVRVRHHLRHQRRIRLRLPARHGHGVPAGGHGAARPLLRHRGRNRQHPDRRGAHAPHHFRPGPPQRAAAVPGPQAARGAAGAPPARPVQQAGAGGQGPASTRGETEEAQLKLYQVSQGMPKHPQLARLLEEPAHRKLLEKIDAAMLTRTCAGRGARAARGAVLHDRRKGARRQPDREGLRGPEPERPRRLRAAGPGDAAGRARRRQDDDEEQQKFEKRQEVQSRYAEKNERIHAVDQLIRAYCVYERDVQYVVQENQVIIVDEYTGRLMPGRRWSDGLHQAVEAKEGVKIERETQTLATITIQNYFRMYEKLSGMTGTAETEADEFHQIYKLDVMVIPDQPADAPGGHQRPDLQDQAREVQRRDRGDHAVPPARASRCWWAPSRSIPRS
jgi:preprotein translocase subunit SecA